MVVADIEAPKVFVFAVVVPQRFFEVLLMSLLCAPRQLNQRLQPAVYGPCHGPLIKTPYLESFYP